MAARLKIADTYKRKVTIELPGSGLKPEKHEITVTFRDLDPDQLQTDQENIQNALQTVLKMIHQLRSGEPDQEELAKAQDQVVAAEGVTTKLEQILVDVEGLEVVGRDGELLQGDELLDFCKRYPRIKTAILKKYDAENETGETAQLGNLLKSGGRGRG